MERAIVCIYEFKRYAALDATVVIFLITHTLFNGNWVLCWHRGCPWVIYSRSAEGFVAAYQYLLAGFTELPFLELSNCQLTRGWNTFSSYKLHVTARQRWHHANKVHSSCPSNDELESCLFDYITNLIVLSVSFSYLRKMLTWIHYIHTEFIQEAQF